MIQHCTSANTSVNSTKLPSVFTQVKDWKKGTTNLDFGGGKFDNATEYLKGKGVTNLIYDPYNRTEEHNKEVLDAVQDMGGADTITCSNVLNVLDSMKAIYDVVKRVHDLLKLNGKAYFTFYEGDKKGHGRITKKDCFQRNQPMTYYKIFLLGQFASVEKVGKVYVCTQPRVI